MLNNSKNAPIQDGAGTTFNADSSTNTAQNQAFVQQVKNLPLELLTQARFFALKAPKKEATPQGWNNTDNQKLYSDLRGVLGFDTSGHGITADYCLLDFDHIFTPNGEFVTDTARKTFEFVQNALCINNRACYCEKSFSGGGSHFVIKPTAGKFPKITNGGNGTLYLDSKHDVKTSPKLEIFYLNESRYCLLTGNVYQCLPNALIPSGEVADNVLNNLLAKIKIQNEEIAAKNAEKNQSAKNTTETNNSPIPETDRALAMLDCIPCSQQTYGDWVTIGMILKNNGNTSADWEHWSATDSARYNVGECERKWAGFKDNGGLTIATLHKFAQVIYGYSEREFQAKWYQDHPEFDSKHTATQDNETPFTIDRQKLFYLPHTDLFNAQRIKMLHGEEIRFVTDSCRWFTFSNGIWVDGGKDTAAVLPFAVDVSRTIFKLAAQSNEIEQKLSKQWQSRKTISNAIELLKGEIEIRITEQDLNNHRNLLNCKNGIVDLQTGKLYPHDSKLLLTQCVNAEYRAGYRNEIVDGFFNAILPDVETQAAVLRYLGYCLTGEISEEKALFIYGAGGNGKGTLTNTLLSLFGDLACSFPIEGILAQKFTKDADIATPAFTKLQWARLAVAEEIPAGQKLNAAKFKLLTGGDRIPIRKLHQEASEITNPTHKFIFSGNHLPELDDVNDAGILRRWLQVKFEQDFTKSRDTKLKQRLQTQDSLSAMLTLLVNNSVQWYKDGLLVSNAMSADRENYFADNDFVSAFINEYCERGGGYSVKLKDLLNAVKMRCHSETANMTDKELRGIIRKVTQAAGIEIRVSVGLTVCFGIRLKSEFAV